MNNHQNCKDSSKLMIGRCVVSSIFVFFTQFALAVVVPHFFPTYSLLTHLPLSVLVLVVITGLWRWCKRLLGVFASAPAMVFFNILFIWGVYIVVVRHAISPLMDILFNGELCMLIFGMWRIVSEDPGLVSHESPCLEELNERSVSEDGSQFELANLTEPPINNSVSFSRIRYCRSCKAYIKGFDHHCPAFGSCIGQNEVGWETNFSGNLAMSTMSFSLLQVLWQVVFLAWHGYCVCYNIKTDEWINWKKYPEFQYTIQSQPDHTLIETRFMNPYNKGIIINLKEFLAPKG